MRPARSPRFQSDARRASIAVMSACGLAEGGAVQAATIITHHTPRIARRRALPGPQRSAGASRGDGPTHPKDAPAVCRGVLAATPSRRLPPFRLAAALRLGARPLLRGPIFRLGSRRLPLGSRLPPRRRHRLIPHRRWGGWHRGCRRIQRLHHPWAGPAALRKIGWLEHRTISPLLVVGGRGLIAYRGNAVTQVRRVTPTARASGADRSRQVSLTMALTGTYVRAAMLARRLLLSATFAWPGVALAQAVTEVQVAPPSVTIKVGERTGLLATAFDRVGNVIPTARVIWSSNNLAVAKVDNDGTVSGVAGGVAIIEARVGARKGQAAVQVIGGAPAAAPPPPGGQAGAGRPTGGGAQPAIGPWAGPPPGRGPGS